jgi:5-formyltetrahydrofolate cyclo-ligase
LTAGGCGVPEFSDSRTHKARLRIAALTARRSLPAAERSRADAALVAALTGYVRTQVAGAAVAGYLPLHDEPGGAALADALADAAAPAALLLPVLLPDCDLDWAVYDGGLRPATRGLREPAGAALGPAAVAAVGLVVAPALAVDWRGVRLGRGGGSYDRALARVPAHTPVLAVLYDGELVDELPDEPHDRRVDAVVTPTGGVTKLPGWAGFAGRTLVE